MHPDLGRMLVPPHDDIGRLTNWLVPNRAEPHGGAPYSLGPSHILSLLAPLTINNHGTHPLPSSRPPQC
jgi:hypothetical protein